MRNILEKITAKMEDFLHENLMFILLISIFNYLGYASSRYIFGKYMYSSILNKGFKLIFGYLNITLFFILIFFMVFLLSKKVSKFIMRLFFLLSLFLFIIDAFLMSKFHLIINGTTVQILAETNNSESMEFLKSNISIGSIVLIFILFFLCYLIPKIKVNIRSKKVLLVIAVLSFAQIFGIKSNLRALPIQRLADGISIAKENKRIYEELKNKINNDVEIVENNSKIPNVVFIIGESTTRNHMGIYGYTLPTTPLLNKLEKRGNLFKFSDVISAHGQTIPSVKKMITFYNGESEKEWYQYNNIIDIMKKAGYKTYWFSNQESKGLFGNLPAAYGNRSDVVLFNANRDSDQEVYDVYDEQIVKKSIDKIGKDSKNYVIYHLLGTHKAYKNRYPQEFSKFNIDDYKNTKYEDEQKETVSEYDNAVLYNDFVVNSIIDIFKDKDAIVIYLSDHGEEVYDFRDLADHGEGNISHYMVEIPFLIYVSDKFIENYPDKVEKIKESVSRPYMTDDVIHTILDISDIETTEYDPTRSVINDKYIPRDRMLHGKSYDNYWKTLN